MELYITFLLFLLNVHHSNTIATSDAIFCINDILYNGVATSAEHSFRLPNDEVYSGSGALPFDLKIGKYSGQMSSIVLSQIPSEEGLDVTLIHYFDDGQGNAFWTSDEAVMTPTDDPSGAVMKVDDRMTIVDGTGDFKCARGKLKNVGTINFVTRKIEVALSGSICGGCE